MNKTRKATKKATKKSEPVPKVVVPAIPEREVYKNVYIRDVEPEALAWFKSEKKRLNYTSMGQYFSALYRAVK